MNRIPKVAPDKPFFADPLEGTFDDGVNESVRILGGLAVPGFHISLY
jgi:hypothetical protein